MIRPLKLFAAVATALVLGGIGMQPAFATTRAGSPRPGPDMAQQLSTLLQELQQQQSTVNSLATQVESEQASVDQLNSKVAEDKKQEALLNQQMDLVARVEYERPTLTLTTVLDARDLGQLLSGVAQARLIARQQKSLVDAAAALKVKDEKDQAAAQAQLDKISQQKAQAVALTASTQGEIAKLQAAGAPGQQAASRPDALTSSGAAGITLGPGPSHPNRFAPGQCTWYVAQIYGIPWNGNANQWPAAAAAAGQAEGLTPVVGAIMESADSWFGHVSVVTSVTDYNDWTVTEMNYLGPYVADTRQVSRGSSNLVTFIY